MNICYRDFPAEIRGTAAYAKKSNQEIAEEVKAGKWGNGKDRKERLEAAGYDYETIQSIVNTMCTTTTAKKSNMEIAKEVKAGKWGNGKDRKERLEAAGYDYKAIQNLVNKMSK